MADGPRAVVLSAAERRAFEANIGKIYVYRFFQNFQFWWPVWVVYLTDLRGLSIAEVAFLEAPFFLSVVVVQIPAGIFADRFGRKPTLAIGTMLSAVAIVAFGSADTYALLLLSYVVWAWSLAIMNAGDNALIYDTLKQLGREDRFQEVVGRSTAIFNMAIVAALLVGAPLAGVVGLDVAVQLSAVASLFGLAIVFTLKEPQFRSPGTRLGYLSYAGDALRLARRDLQIPLLMVLFAFLAVGAIGTAVFFQPFLNGHDVGVANLGYLQAPARVFGAIGALAAFWLGRRAGERRTLYLVAAATAGAYLVLGVWDSLGAFVMFPVISLATAASIPLVTDMLNRRIPSDLRATILSGGQLMLALLMAGFGPLLGAVTDASSLRAGFFVGGLVIGAGALATLLLLRSVGSERVPTFVDEPVPAGGG